MFHEPIHRGRDEQDFRAEQELTMSRTTYDAIPTRHAQAHACEKPCAFDGLENTDDTYAAASSPGVGRREQERGRLEPCCQLADAASLGDMAGPFDEGHQ